MIYVAAGVVLGLTIVWVIGSRLCAPAPRAVDAPPDLAVEAVTFPSESGTTLHGWVARPGAPRGVVVLLHGVRSTRLEMLSRARILLRAGYAVVMPDFQAHGASPGHRITFGYLESRDARATVKFAKERFPGQPVGVIGVSLGGAAALLAQPALDVQAMVLEAVFPTIRDAVEDRIELATTSLARWMSPLLTWQLKPRVGCGPGDLCPIERVAELKVPKLFIAGTNDRHTRISESREMFRRAAEPKQIWEVEGAKHEDFHAFNPGAYERHVLDFFANYLK